MDELRAAALRGDARAKIVVIDDHAEHTEDVTRNIGGVAQAAQEAGSAASQVLGASDTLKQKSEELRERVSGFLGDIPTVQLGSPR